MFQIECAASVILENLDAPRNSNLEISAKADLCIRTFWIDQPRSALKALRFQYNFECEIFDARVCSDRIPYKTNNLRIIGRTEFRLEIQFGHRCQLRAADSQIRMPDISRVQSRLPYKQTKRSLLIPLRRFMVRTGFDSCGVRLDGRAQVKPPTISWLSPIKLIASTSS